LGLGTLSKQLAQGCYPVDIVA